MSTARELYLSRARLRRDAPISALRELLSGGDDIRMAAGHRMVWSLFANHPEQRRDFLWREAEPGTFYLLSARPPEDRAGIFHLDSPKPFAPHLEAADRLRFVLRVNATVSRKAQGKQGGTGPVRGGRCDIVMDALHTVPPSERAAKRKEVIPRVATDWLKRQGEEHGFALAEPQRRADWEAFEDEADALSTLQATGYRVLHVARGARGQPMRLGVLDLQGALIVRDPARFAAALTHGFGRAKSFGCGLMLIRRDS